MVAAAIEILEKATQTMTKEQKRIFLKELRERLLADIKELDDLIKAN